MAALSTRFGETLVEVVTSPLLSQPVDALLISANNWLDAGSGVARDVRKAAGSAYEDECEELVRSAGPYGLSQGSAFVTAGHALEDGGKRRYVLQAITIYYPKRGTADDRQRATAGAVYWSAREALAMASERGLVDVATYLLAYRAAYRAAPARDMADALCHAIAHHCKTGTSLSRVVIAEQEAERVTAAAAALERAARLEGMQDNQQPPLLPAQLQKAIRLRWPAYYESGIHATEFKSLRPGDPGYIALARGDYPGALEANGMSFEAIGRAAAEYYARRPSLEYGSVMKP